MLLDRLGPAGPARRVREAVRAAFADQDVLLDEAGSPLCGTRAVSAAVCARV